MINLSCKVIACGIILSSVKLEKKILHSENDIRISHNLLSPSPLFPKDYCIRSFWSQNTEKRNNAIFQMRLGASSSLLTSPPYPSQRLLYSFLLEPKHRNNTISQMRLRSVFKMRISILNTATTEQMGYGIISFFVCFL